MAETAKAKLNSKQILIMVALCTAYFFAPTFNAVSSTLQFLPAHYGIMEADASWVNTIANPTAALAGLLCGIFAGKRLSYRNTMILALVMFAVCGALPALWQGIPFVGLIVSRLLFGLGCGCINPCVQAIVTRMFESETARSACIGIINIIFSIGATVGSIITGALANDGVWQNAYWFYALAILPLILVIVFVRDKDILVSMEEEKAADAPKEKATLPAVAIAFILMFFLSVICCQTFFGYSGIAIAESGADALMIGTVFSTFTVAGMVVAAVFAPMWKALRLFCMPVAMVLMTAGYALCLLGYSAGNIVFFFAASAVIGFGTCIAGMVMPMVMSVTVLPAALTLAIGLQEVARNMGGFFSSFWLSTIGRVFGDTATTQYWAILVLCAVVALIGFVVSAKYNKQFKNTDAK